MFLLSLALAAEPDTAERDIPIPPGTAEDGAPGGEPAPEEPGAAPAPTPAPATATPPPAESRDLSVEARRREAARLYLQALDSWKQRRWKRAWWLASESLTLDPELTPARMLAGYALLKMKRRDEGAETLAGLALEPGASPLPAERLREAERVVHRHLAPYRRDQWALSVGNVTFVQRMGDTAVPVNGYVFAGRVPLFDRLALRVDGGAPWGATANDLDVRGPRFGVYALTSQPLGSGRWHVDLAAGPAFWLAEGRYWADGSEPYVGARGAVAVDVRLGALIGLRYEMGASVFPLAAEDLPFYAEPLDIRFSIETWFGR